MLGHLLLTLAFFCFVCNTNGLKIDDTDGGYVDLLVSIHPDTPPNDVIVDNLKILLQSSSEFLHEATGGRVFIKQAAIQFPKTWPERITARSTPKFSFSKSDVRVEEFKSVHNEHFFSTKLRRGCGKRGDFIRVSPNVLTVLNSTKEALKDATYAFVNEWAHFRYGVFYEYGRLGHKKYPMSYCPCCNKEVVRWNSCSDRIEHFILNDNCEYHDGCYASEECVVMTTQPKRDPVESSIMFLPRLENIKHFCNSEEESHRHNKLAPNMHNDICKGESTWDVIRRNVDFTNLPPRNMSKPILVEFDEIQQKSVTSLRAVLVLDVSGSMKAHKRLEILKDALDSFLLNLLDDFIMLAIVTFSTVAKVQHPMTAVNHQTVQGFRDVVKDMSVDAQTCIGCGLRRALEVLNTSSETPEGAIIVLFTDGEENKQPFIDDVWPQLLASKVEVVTMAMGDKAEEKLEKLAAETKGQSYFFPDRVENTLRTYIEGVNSHADEFTHHPPGLITPNKTAECSTSERMVDGEGTTGPHHRDFTLQVAALKADAAMPHREATNKLSNLAEATRLVISQSANGECFQSPGYNPKYDMQTAFGDTANPNKKYSLKLIQVMSETKGFTRTIQETFILDEELGNNTIVTISPVHKGSYSFTAWLVDPTGQRCQNCPEVDSDREKSLTIPSPAMPGTWKLQVESSSTDHVVVSMRVISQIRDLTNEPIVALCEASQKELSEPQEAVIFVDLSKGDNVVLNASVTAVVLNTKGLNCPVPLYDDGNDPDLMEDDGMYSGYFTQFTGQGRYSIMAYVYGDNRTSHAYRRPGFPPEHIITDWNGTLSPPAPIKRAPANYTFKDTLLGDMEPTRPFQRVVVSAYFHVTSDLRQTDVPPGRISDLRAVEGHVEIDRTAVVRLTWTWPGAHMTHGKATAVEIRGGTDDDALERNFDSHEVLSKVVKGNLDPLPAGSKQDVTIALPRNWETMTHGDRDFKLTAYLAARVINADGLKSELSNIVSAELQILNFTPISPTTGADTTPRAGQHAKPAQTNTAPEKPYKKTDAATTSTPSTKAVPHLDPAPTNTAEAVHSKKDDNSSVIIWIMLALAAVVAMTSITIMLLLRAKSSTTAENEGAATSTETTTTM